MNVIDNILLEWSYRCPDGIVDMNDPKKLVILDEILIENFNITLNENIYSKSLSIPDLFKDPEFPEDETRGDTIKRFVEEEIPFMLSDGSIKVLKFYNETIKDIFDKRNYNELKKEKVIFVDKNNQIYTLKDLVKTKDFRGQEKGSSTKHETIALTELNNQIKSILSDKKINSIRVKVGENTYDNIIAVENQPGTPKSDFNLIDLNNNSKVFVSHKMEGGPSSFLRWGGFQFAYEEQNSEVLKFVENIKSKISNNEFKSGDNFSQKIVSDTLKKRIVFGKDFGKNFGINNVQIVTQGKVYLKEIKDDLYELIADNFWLNGDLPTGGYEPVLNAAFRKSSNTFKIENCQAFSRTLESVKTSTFFDVRDQEEKEDQTPLPDDKYIRVPPEFRLGKTYVDKEWLKDKPTEITQHFDTNAVISQNNREWVPLSNNSTKKLREDLTEE